MDTRTHIRVYLKSSFRSSASTLLSVGANESMQEQYGNHEQVEEITTD